MPTVVVDVADRDGLPDFAAHVDLKAGEVTEVVFQGDATPLRPINSETVREVEVIVVECVEPVWWTTDGSDPAVRGGRSFVVPDAGSSDVRRPTTFLPTRVKLVSAGDAVVSVQRVV